MSSMLETESNWVKGVDEIDYDVIEIWSYRMVNLIDRFDEHGGSVRGVHFHKSLPVLVSGGDDSKIKVWNYKTHCCSFTLIGQLDYIRIKQLHDKSPWIVNVSDDQTIRIWNWLSRTCISILTCHNHLVMCTSFHPKEDLIVSASLDQTVLVWDIGPLRKKTLSPEDDILISSQMNTDLFGRRLNVVVNYTEKVYSEVGNWRSYLPLIGSYLPLIVSEAEDAHMKLWSMNEIQERVKILLSTGHLHLAYITVQTHGLFETAEKLAAELGDDIPLLNAADWPMLRVMSGIFELVLDRNIKFAYLSIAKGKFSDVLRLFCNVLYIIPVVVVHSRRKVDQLKKQIESAREYVLGFKIDMERNKIKDDVIRQQELAAYFTNCNLPFYHARLVLTSAMSICLEGGSYATATHFARMLLESSPTDTQSRKAKELIEACGDKRDSHKLNYDYQNPFVVCGATFVPIYRGQKDVSCPYCGARFIPSIQGQLCTICKMAVVGGPIHPVFSSLRRSCNN